MPLRPLALARRLLRDEAGTTSIEYAVIATLVSTFIIGSLMAFEDGLTSVFTYVHTTVMGALGS